MSGSSSFIQHSSRSNATPRTRRSRRNRVPTTPFASDDDHSWQGEVSWTFEATGLREYSTNFSSVLSPWPANSPSDHSRVFRQSANDYYLSRTSRFRGLTNSSHEHSSYGRVELRSHVAATYNDRRYFDQYSQPQPQPQPRGFSKLRIIQEGGSGRGKSSPLAVEDELSKIDYSITDEPAVISPYRNGHHDLELSSVKHDHGDYGGRYYVGHGVPSSLSSKTSSQLYSHHDIQKVSGYYDDEGDEEDMDEEDAGPPRTVGLFSLFRYTTKWDWVLVFVGCLGALINGGSLPWYSYLFGDLVNKLSGEADSDKTQMMKDVEKVLILPYFFFFINIYSNVCT